MVMPGESPEIITNVLEEAGDAAAAAPLQDDATASQEMVRISALSPATHWYFLVVSRAATFL
jgi:hypothetical protein